MRKESIAIIFVFLILMQGYCTSVHATKRAIVFGLGKYQDQSWSTIHGDRDADIVKNMLIKNSFTDIKVLKNENATKKNMVNAFVELTKRCKLGDVVYIHYSGHGQLMTDLDGDEADLWTGKHRNWDESWIPYDAYMNYCKEDRGEKHFCDDEVAAYLLEIRKKIGAKGEIVVVIDACHSGDSTRGKGKECVRGVDTNFCIPKVPEMPKRKHIEEKWLTISACKPYQLCFEKRNPQVGKLTYILCSIGKKLFTLNNKELHALINREMKKDPPRIPQNPVVSGKK